MKVVTKLCNCHNPTSLKKFL